ncbi:MAG: hypothetical protein JJU01_06785 [Alkalibacterium sp.]|nr:hypothetical protein [Alkalibacterium sp.]
MEKFHRLVQQFLNEHGDEFDSPIEAVNHFTEEYNKKIRTNAQFEETAEMQSLDKLEEALSTRSIKRQKKLLDEAITLWPENWDAQSTLIKLNTSDDEASLIENYAFLEKRARKHWSKHTDQAGYRNVEERPYLRLKATLGFLYMEAGMIDHALDHLTELYRMDKSDALGTRYKIITLYVRKFDWKNAWRFYQKVESADQEDQMLLPIIILAVLTDRQDLAKSLLKKLVDINSEIGYLFAGHMWPVDDLYDDDIVFADRYQPFTYQSLLISLRDILYVVMENSYLFDWLKKEVFNLIPDRRAEPRQNRLFSGIIDPNADGEVVGAGFRDSLRDDPSNPLRNISYERTRQLYIAGLKTYEDFSEITEKDVLGLKGVGPVTIKDLKNNGVKFRDS